MGTLTSNNKLLHAGGNVLVTLSGLELTGSSATFPFIITNQSANPNSARLTVGFNKPTTVTVDYGNGYKRIFNPTTTFTIYRDLSSPNAPHSIYYYPDGVVKPRRVKIIYDRRNLTTFYTANMGYVMQPLMFRFSDHPEVNTFEIVNNPFVTNIDIDTVTRTSNPKLTTLTITFFNVQSKYYNQIPLNLLYLPLRDFSFGGLGFKNQSHADSNSDKISLLKDTLTTLGVAVNLAWDDTNGLPDSWSELYKLTELLIQGCRFTSVPMPLRGLTTLKILRLSLCPLLSFEGLGNMINMEQMSFSTEMLLLPLGTYFDGMTKLRNISAAGKVISANHATTYIQSWYNKVNELASKTVGATQLRNMTFSIQQNGTNDSNTVIPDGIYQQPAGYVQGVSNGTPASSLERIWVLVNQYRHTWTYRAV